MHSLMEYILRMEYRVMDSALPVMHRLEGIRYAAHLRSTRLHLPPEPSWRVGRLLRRLG